MAQFLAASPMTTTNAGGMFGVESQGYIQGVAMDDPANRFNLAQGTLAAGEALPMWGGVGIQESLPGIKSGPRGSVIRRATSLGNLEGFSVFNQAHNGLVTPQSPVPMYLTDMSVSYYRFGSNMRVPLKASAAVVALGLAGASVKTPLAWDFVNSQLNTVADAAYAGADVDTTAITYADGVVTATAANHGLAVGKFITISDAVPAQYNGIYQVASVPSANTFTYVPATAPTASPATTQGVISAVDAADITLPVKLIRIQSGNCKTVVFDPVNGYLNWNENDSCALILL